MKRCVFYCLLFAISMVRTTEAQTPFFQQHFLLKKNEPLQVNTLFQDRQGFVWFGTVRGLFRFDGITQQHFTLADSLPDINITALAEDSLGRIWIGGSNGTMAVLEKGIIKKFKTAEGDVGGAISDILFDRSGTLWFSTLDDGLYYYNRERLYRLDDTDGMPDLYVYDIAEDEQGNIWAGTDAGVVKCARKGDRYQLTVFDSRNGLPDNIIRKVTPGPGGKLWMATEDKGLVQFDVEAKRFIPLDPDWSQGVVADVILKDHQLWMSNPPTGLRVYDLASGSEKVYGNHVVNGIGAAGRLLKDREGNIWCGLKNGILRTPGDALEYIHNTGANTDKNILAVTSDKQGRVWFSNAEGLFTWQRGDGGEPEIRKQLAGTSFQRNTIISLYTDSAGYIWAGLYGEGVLHIDPRTGKTKHLGTELRNGNVLSITGKGNDVWLATLGGGTRIQVKGERYTVTNYSRADGLASDFIYQVFIDSRNRVWFATDGRGVSMLDANGFHHYEQGLPSGVVYGLTEDGTGQLWANVQGSGLFTFDGKKFKATSAEHPLRDNNIHCLATDRNGNVIAMHDFGMDIIDRATGNVRYLGEEVGLRDNIATLNGITRDHGGNLWLATSGGIIRFSGSADFVRRKPLPGILQVKVFDQVIDIADKNRLAYDEDNLTIQFRGTWYQNANGLLFRYRLDQYDRDWMETRERAVTYSRLPPGEYTFRLKVSDSQKFSNDEASFSFVIQPPFWRTNAFYILSSVFVAVTIALFVRQRERRLLRDKHILEGKVRIRTLEIQRQNDEIQAQNEEIMAQAEEINGINENLEMLVKERTAELERKNKALEEYAFINAHKLRSPLASILGLVNLVLKTPLTEEGREIGKRLEKSAHELDDVVRSITKTIEKAEKRHPMD